MTATRKPLGTRGLMNVLLAPHVTEKTSLGLQEHNQYAFRVRRDATRTDVRRAVELMFEVKVEGVQVVNAAGQAAPLRRPQRPHAGLEEGLRAPGRRPEHRLRSAGARPSAEAARTTGTPWR